MTSDKLVRAYLEKAKLRIKVLHYLHSLGGFSDVVREAQECVELLLKALLRAAGIEAPKVHDVSRTLRDNASAFPLEVNAELDALCRISRELRKERELSLYGTEDWIPTEEYSADDSLRAISSAEKVYQVVSAALERS